VVSRLSRRAVELFVLAFALIGFVSVPLGDRTGFQHLYAVLSTDAALRFASGLLEALRSARGKLFEAPSPGGPADPRSGPRPEPPALELRTGADAGAPDASLRYASGA